MERLRNNAHNLAALLIILSFSGLALYTYNNHINRISENTILKKRRAGYDGYVTFYEDSNVQCGWVNGTVAMYSAPSTKSVAKKILKKDVASYLSDAAKKRLCIY